MDSVETNTCKLCWDEVDELMSCEECAWEDMCDGCFAEHDCGEDTPDAD